MKISISTFILVACVAFRSFSQVKDVKELDVALLNWYNRDFAATNIVGTSVDKAYELLESSSKSGETVIVAVIDSGIDVEHEDLQGKIWVNDDEIPSNNIDDDGNGYVDDIHGWNFLGNENGANINYENFEYTRIVRENDANNPDLLAAKEMYDAEMEKRQKEQANIQKFKEIYLTAKSIIQTKTGVAVTSSEDLALIQSTDQQVQAAKEFLQERYAMGFSEEGLDAFVTHNNDYMNYYLNVAFDVRSIVGDDPEDIDDKTYGNPDVTGPRSNHGTGVSGVIAANRDNAIGIDGIATNVKIMCLRAVPNGDERDKDIALSIYYAVDNGADIINMSFGKAFSSQKQFVDDAVRYAERKGVLMIHAAGNSGKNIDEQANYPSGHYIDGVEATNWLNVGASSKDLDMEVAAVFSNYGQNQVDIFAPGVDVISTDSTGTYSMNNGTSLAAPVVSGIAAMVLSYYPDLKPAELIDILLTSSFKFKKPKKVLIPTSEDEKRKKIKFKELSKSGGIVNACEALLEAERRSKT